MEKSGRPVIKPCRYSKYSFFQWPAILLARVIFSPLTQFKSGECYTTIFAKQKQPKNQQSRRIKAVFSYFNCKSWDTLI